MVFKTVASSAKTIVDLTDAYTVSLSNESVSIACDVAGTAIAGELGVAGKAVSVISAYKGSLALTPVAAGATPGVGQYKYIIGTTTGSTVIRSNDSTFYIATLLADAGSVPVTIYLEGNTTTIAKTLTWNKSKTGATGKAVVSITEEYYYSTSSSTQSDSSWGTAVPAWVNGRYLWTRTRTVFSSGPDSLTNPVCITGQKGTDGTIYYTWVKYADNADGTIGMSDTPAGKRYIGISVNQTSSTESTTPTFYTWSPLYDNVVVGGTNLWLDSSPEKSLANWNVGDGTKTLDATMLWEGKPTIKFVKASVATGGLSNNNVRSGLPASTQFAYSFMVRSSVSMPLNANSMGHMQVLGTSDGGANYHRETAITYSPTTIPANVWTKATIVFSTPAEAIAGETFTFRSFLYYLTYGATYYFSDFQLEKGNISSDWTPAPEDVSNQIETKAKTFTSTPVVPYNSGDIWKNGTATYVSTVTRLTGTYTVNDWTKVGDVTIENTAKDTTMVGGTAAATIVSGASAGTTANELAKAMTSGKSLYKDNVFAVDLNGLTVYNNSANSNVTVTRITNPADTPTTSTHAVEIKNIGTASPGIGGFIQPLTARANAKFVVRYIAKIPVGYTIATASNSMGTGYTDLFLTATAGTGKYEEYIRVVRCGATGSFSNGGHVYLNGAAGSVATPVVWYVARIDTYDVTDYEPFASHINADPNTVRISGSKLHFTDQVLMDNAWIDKLVANSIVTNKIQATDIAAGRITSGSISADRIAANSLSGDKIIANTIDATRLKIGSGAQGGYINNPRFTSWSGAYPDGTILWSAGGISKVTVDTVPMAQFAPAAGAQQGMQLNSSYFANGIDLDGMQYFALECRFRLTSGTNPAGASLLVDIYRQDNSYERMQLDMKEVGATVTTNTWYVARKVFKLEDANVAKTFKSVGGYLLANWSGAGDAAKTIQFASVNMFQASAQEFLAQSWTNGGTTSINGGFIATGTLSADKITTGSLNASLITTGALDASLITTGNLDASRITAGVINAGNGKSTIDMSTGAFNFGSGKIAYDGTTLLLNVDSLKITNSSVATEVYASLAAGTAKTEAISAAATDATSKVNSIEIGGRNLVPKTNKGKTGWGWNKHSGTYSLEDITSLGVNAVKASCTTKSTSWEVLYRTLNLSLISPNTEYTISFDLYPSKSGTIENIYITKNNGTNILADFGSQTYTANTWNKVVKTAITTSAPISDQYIYLTGLCGVDGSSVIIANLKIEKGNKATDWTPAPEDVAYDIEQKADSAEVAGNLNIVSTAAAQAKSIADAKLNKNTYDDFVKEYGEYKTALAVDQSVAAGNLQAAQTAVASIKKEMGDMKESWMFNNGTKIEATPNGMLISDGNPSGMNMLLSQNRLSFFDGGVEVAYIADKTMKINNGIFVKSAQIGSHLISTSPANSDITIVSFVGEG